MEKNAKYSKIREELRLRQAESQAIRKQIHASKGMDKWALWQDKRAYGVETRYLLLAYAFLRGMPYLACEPKSSVQPWSVAIAKTASAHAEAVGYGSGEVSDADVQAWLDAAPEAAQEVAA